MLPAMNKYKMEEIPKEYQIINWISEDLLDKSFWKIVDRDPQHEPSKATRATTCMDLLSGEKTNKIDKNPITKTSHLPFDCFSLRIKYAKILIMLGLK